MPPEELSGQWSQFRASPFCVSDDVRSDQGPEAHVAAWRPRDGDGGGRHGTANLLQPTPFGHGQNGRTGTVTGRF